MEAVVIDSGVCFLDPGRADEVGVDPRRRGAQGGWGVPFAAVGEVLDVRLFSFKISD